MMLHDVTKKKKKKDHNPNWIQNINELDTEYRLIIGVLDLEKQKHF